MSLRRFLTIGLFLLFVCGCLTAGALWYSTRRSSSIIDELTESVESANIAHLVQRDLSAHRRQLLLLNSAIEDEQKSRTEKAIASLRQDTRHLTDLISTPQEQKFVESVQAKVLSYLQNYEALQSSGVRGAILYQSTSQQYDDTQSAIQDLIRFNIDEVNQLELQSARQNTLNYVLVVLSFSLFVIVLLTLLFGLRKFLYIPILKLERAIEKFELGAEIDSGDLTGTTEIKAIASSFNRMSSRLSKQKEMQLMFVSSVAHDLKNPMGAIAMAADIASESTDMTSESKELLAVIKRQVGHLNRLISDLLDTTRIESGHLELSLKTCDLRALLRDSVLLHSSLSTIHEIALEDPSGPVLVKCDQHRISQVFNNLLNNAIKYSPNGGQIKVSLKNENQDAVIEIRDQGIGIPFQEIEGIFEPFRRSSTSRNSIPGVGLGLSASQKIIKAHEGGDILVRSIENKGTIFTIRLKRLPEGDLFSSQQAANPIL